MLFFFQEEYQKIQERRELEENYVHFKSVFGSHSPVKGTGTGNGTETGTEDLEESNPFFEESESPNGDSNPFSSEDGGNLFENEDYDDSGKNPFF